MKSLPLFRQAQSLKAQADSIALAAHKAKLSDSPGIQAQIATLRSQADCLTIRARAIVQANIRSK